MRRRGERSCIDLCMDGCAPNPYMGAKNCTVFWKIIGSGIGIGLAAGCAHANLMPCNAMQRSALCTLCSVCSCPLPAARSTIAFIEAAVRRQLRVARALALTFLAADRCLSIISDLMLEGGTAACPCADSTTWTSPINGGSCWTYMTGDVNEGYCASDEAYAYCPFTCDSCPECEEAPLLGVTDYWPVWVPTCLEVTLDESGATEVDVVSLLTTLEQDWLSALDKAYICAYLYYPVSLMPSLASTTAAGRVHGSCSRMPSVRPLLIDALAGAWCEQGHSWPLSPAAANLQMR